MAVYQIEQKRYLNNCILEQKKCDSQQDCFASQANGIKLGQLKMQLKDNTFKFTEEFRKELRLILLARLKSNDRLKQNTFTYITACTATEIRISLT